MIVKNEEHCLPRCLDSLVGLSDELVIVDTGSSDRTVEIARERGATLLEHSWNGDYAEARNVGLRHAKGSFILYIDADEEIVAEDREPLRQALLSGEHDVINMRIISPLGGSDKTGIERYVRVFRNYPDIAFRYRIHEQIWPSLAPHQPRVLDGSFRILHHGYNVDPPALEKKRQRNLDTALLILSDEPNNSYYLYHAGFSYLTLGQPEQAVRWLERALHFTEPGNSQVVVLNAIAQAHYDQKQLDAAATHLRDSTRICPQQLHGWALLADIHLAQQRHAEAISTLKACLAVEASALHADVSPDLATLWMKLGLCQLLTHQPEQAEQSLERAMDQGLAAEQHSTAERYLGMARRMR